MAITMQLFSVADLTLLTRAQVEDLRALFAAQTHAPLPEALAAVRPLVAREYLRLTQRDPYPLAPPYDPADLETTLLEQLFDDADLAYLDAKMTLILQTVAECALLHHPEAVAAVGAVARERFTTWTGRPPHGPDLPRVQRTLEETQP